MGTQCPFFKNPQSKYEIYSKHFVKNTIFVIDSASNAHITNDENSLIDYGKFSSPISIKFNIKDRTYSAQAIGWGRMPVLMKVKLNQTIVVLNKVYLSPTAEEKIISANSFNVQFKTLITLNTNSGVIYARKINSKIANLETSNGIYRLYGKTICTSNDLSNSFSGSIIDNIKFNSNLSVQHLPLLINLNEITNKLDPRDNESDTEPDTDNDLNDTFKCKTKISNKKRKQLSPKELKKRLKETHLWHRRFAHASALCVHKNSKVTIGMCRVLSEN